MALSGNSTGTFRFYQGYITKLSMECVYFLYSVASSLIFLPLQDTSLEYVYAIEWVERDSDEKKRKEFIDISHEYTKFRP